MDFKKLETEYSQVKGDPLGSIKFFESNLDAIEALDDNDEKQQRFKLATHGDYGLNLSSMGSTRKAVDVLATLIPRFEKESGLTEAELLEIPYYEYLLWAFASSLYYTDRIEEAEKTLEQLVKMQPDNQKYKDWLRATKAKKFSKIRNGLYISVFVWFFIYILFKESMDIGLRGILLFGGVLVLGVMIVLEIYVLLAKRSVR